MDDPLQCNAGVGHREDPEYLTRLAIGALEQDMLIQFLVEEVVLSSLGVTLDIILAIAACLGLTAQLRGTFIFKRLIILMAFLFSAAVGVLRSYFPERKVTRLDLIDALRYE